MMTQNKCENACWAGIQPEITEPESVQRILNKYYGDKNVSTTNGDDWSVIGWTNADSTTPPYSGGVVIKDNYVSRIEVYFETLIVEDVISAIGEPEVVLVMPNSSIPQCYGIWSLFYSSTGLELELGQDGLLESTDKVFKLVIGKPLSQDSERLPKMPEYYRMLSWQGYNHDYCSFIKPTGQP